jgi:hypothetical protein
LTILNAALECEEFQFAKQSAILWLVNYPGDLYVQYLQAKVYEKSGNISEAISIYQNLIASDPFFAEPYNSLAQLADSEQENALLSTIHKFLRQEDPPETSPDWMVYLWQTRSAFAEGNYEKSISLIHQILIEDPVSPLPAIFHLKIANKMNNQEMLRNLSEIYFEKYPKCLQIMILKAISEIEAGEEAVAVERLHWVAAHDSSGQVIQRLMGTHHRFISLWPEDLEIFFDIPIPATVNAFLGLNKLQSGIIEEPEFKQKPRVAPVSSRHSDVTQQIRVTKLSQIVEDTEEQNLKPQEVLPQEDSEDIDDGIIEGDFATKADFVEIQKTFTKIAKRLKKPELERTDNRFPVYVIMSSKHQLENAYGPNTTAVIDSELKKLTNLVQKLPGWSALQFFLDDPAQMAQLGLTPRIGTDAWQFKLALVDLDEALGKRGEMIGALLIVGGPEIVPFHHLPNPTLDNDLDVPSDNPYASIDENYFIPQWPVGRLPGESGSDAGLLLYQIRHLIYQYEQKTKSLNSKGVPLTSIFSWIWSFLSNLGGLYTTSEDLGYSAEVWQKASEKVFSTLGKTRELKLSPPVNSDNLVVNKKHSLELGYFNLHGIKDGPHWYGQKDFSSLTDGPDYPIALTPEMFDNHTASPDFVLSEACYGANIVGKRHEEALSLKFLDSGTNAFVGSTCIAYGSIATPLIAADYIAESFWQRILEGQPAGYAIMQAKLKLTEEMSLSQGFLDGEDQKTILSFVLYGDPLGTYDGLKVMPKPLFRIKSHPKVRTLSDSDLKPAFEGKQVPPTIDKNVKKLMEKYLPGLEDPQMSFNKSETSNNRKSNKSQSSDRYVVTLQKSFNPSDSLTHHYYARMTLDKKGNLLKLTTSR